MSALPARFPKIPSYRITDLAEAIAPECKLEVVGIRPGEKIHEDMIVSADAGSTVDLGEYYAILPAARGITAEKYAKHRPCTPVAPEFCYHSGDAGTYLSVEELRQLIREHVDPEFTV